MPRIHVPLFERGKLVDRTFSRVRLERILSGIVRFSVLYKGVQEYAHLIERTALRRSVSRFKCNVYLDRDTFAKLHQIKSNIRLLHSSNIEPRFDNIAQSMIVAEITKSCELPSENVLCRGEINKEVLGEFLENRIEEDSDLSENERVELRYFREIQQRSSENIVRVKPTGLGNSIRPNPEFNQLSRKVSSWTRESQKIASPVPRQDEKPLAPELQAFLQM